MLQGRACTEHVIPLFEQILTEIQVTDLQSQTTDLRSLGSLRVLITIDATTVQNDGLQLLEIMELALDLLKPNFLYCLSTDLDSILCDFSETIFLS